MTATKYTYSDFRDAVFKLLDEYSLNGVSGKESGSFVTDAEKRLSLYLGNAASKVYGDFPEIKRTRLDFPKLPILYSAENLTLDTDDYVSIPIHSDGTNVPAFACHAVFTGSIKLTTSRFFSETVSGEFESAPGEYREVRIDLPAPDDEHTFKISPSDGGKCHIRSVVIYCLSDAETDIPYTDIPPLGKCAARLPSDCARLEGIYLSGKNTVGTDGFYISDGLIIADEALCGSYEISYSAKPPVFSEDMDGIAMSSEKFSLITRLCAIELCPTEDSELYMRLSVSYNAFADALRRRRETPSYARNSFFGKCERLPSRLIYGKKGE